MTTDIERGGGIDVSGSHEPSYYEIALTNRQVVVAFVVLLVCVVAAFLSGVWLGRESAARAQEKLALLTRGAAAGAATGNGEGSATDLAKPEGQALQEFKFFADSRHRSNEAGAGTPAGAGDRKTGTAAGNSAGAVAGDDAPAADADANEGAGGAAAPSGAAAKGANGNGKTNGKASSGDQAAAKGARAPGAAAFGDSPAAGGGAAAPASGAAASHAGRAAATTATTATTATSGSATAGAAAKSTRAAAAAAGTKPAAAGGDSPSAAAGRDGNGDVVKPRALPDGGSKSASGAAGDKAAGGEVVIQVFSSADKEQADRVKDGLVQSGLPAFLSPITKDSQTMYRVRIGPFPNRAAAEPVAEKVRKEQKLDTWITPK